MIVYGDTRSQHDERLREVLQRLQDRGLTVTTKKCKFGVQELEFMGLLFTQHGVAPTYAKVKAIHDRKTPSNAGKL